jgi:flavin-dependent dehydrogenase
MSSDREATRSVVQIAPIRPPAGRYDVAILGGGLAGLTLAIQIKSERPETRILVLEKREGPAPQAAFKVGESTVPSGAHYFAEVVGMKSHLEEEELLKCGLRYFLTADGNADITKRVEVGPARFPAHDNYQLDRGLFENKLAARARSLGVDLQQGARVSDVTFGSEVHEVTFTQLDETISMHARWVVDATGRASLLKRKLGLGTDSGHHINSAWFRLGGGLDLEEWGSAAPGWMARMSEPGLRKFSTNHLFGEGYWIWLIPLSTGPISIGLCADPRFHPFEEINDFDHLLDWLRVHEPQLAAAVEPRVEDIEDFLRVQDFSYDVEQAYSQDRWSLVGEAAAFADPLFSPGSDFIGYGNVFTGDLIKRDLDGEDITELIDHYNSLYRRTFAYVLAKTRDMYPVFGNPYVASGLLGWDVYVNHTNIVLLMLKNKLTDREFMRSVDDHLDRMYRLNINMQKLFREWNELLPPEASQDRKFKHTYRPSSLTAMVAEYDDDDALREQLRRELQTAEALAVAIFHRAAASLPDPPSPDRAINPYAVGLRPETWDADGLFDAPGLTLAEAAPAADGFERIWADPAAPDGPPPGRPAGP